MSGQEFLEAEEVDPLTSFTPGEDTYFLAKAGASSAGVFLNGFTVEGRLLWERTVAAQSTSAEWCTEEGVVVEDTNISAAESCQTRPVGRPSTSNKNLAANLRFGYVHVKSGAFRIAGGPSYVLSEEVDGAGLNHNLGAQVPFYFNFLAVPRRKQKLDYDGLVRISPFFDLATKRSAAGMVPYKIGVSFALLGRRSMFSTKYDEL